MSDEILGINLNNPEINAETFVNEVLDNDLKAVRENTAILPLLMIQLIRELKSLNSNVIDVESAVEAIRAFR